MGGGVVVVGLLVTEPEVGVGAVEDCIGDVDIGVGIVAAMAGGIGVLGGMVVVIVVGMEGRGVGSSQHETWMMLGGNCPFLTLMSVEEKVVGPDAFSPIVLLPWARTFALLKHQFWDPGFQL